MLPTHGAKVTVDQQRIVVQPTLLHACLHGDCTEFSRASLEVAQLQAVAPTQLNPGWIRVPVAGDAVGSGEADCLTLRFAARDLTTFEQMLGVLQGRIDAKDLPDHSDQVAAAATSASQSSSNAGAATAANAGANAGPFRIVALDVETANSDSGSICQIGVCRVIDGEIDERQTWLCQPPAAINKFEDINVAIHGITADDVATAEPFSSAWEKAQAFIGDDLVVAHNAAFDSVAVYRACKAANITPPTLKFACTLALARTMKLGQHNNRLPEVARALDVPMGNHHDAGDDAAAAALIFSRMAQRAQATSSGIDFFTTSGFSIGAINESGVTHVLRMEPAAAAQAAPAPQPQRRQPRWAKARQPEVLPEPNPDPPADSVLAGEVVVLSGDFAPHDKAELFNQIAHMGGQVAKNVTKKTTLVVCGPWDSKTSKQKRAEELGLPIWTPEQLYTALGIS